MAHEIVDSQIAYANQVPWHGLGKEMKPSDSPAKFLKAAKLDWTVDPQPMFIETPDGPVKVPGKAAMVRSSDNKVMTIAGENWKPLQNADALAFMSKYVKAGGATMEVAGALRDGQVIWGLARLNRSFEVRKGDVVNGYLLITSPHIAGSAIKVSTTTVRVVCANTMAASRKAEQIHYTQSHRDEFDVLAAQAHVEGAIESLGQMEKRCKILDKLKINAEDAVKKVLVPTFRPGMENDAELMKSIMDPDKTPKDIAAIIESMEAGPGAVPNTGWGVLNGVTHYIDHVRGYKQEARFSSGTMGWGAKRKERAQELLLQLAA